MTANNMHSVNDPSRPGVQLDLTNHKGVQGLGEKREHLETWVRIGLQNFRAGNVP